MVYWAQPHYATSFQWEGNCTVQNQAIICQYGLGIEAKLWVVTVMCTFRTRQRQMRLTTDEWRRQRIKIHVPWYFETLGIVFTKRMKLSSESLAILVGPYSPGFNKLIHKDPGSNRVSVRTVTHILCLRWKLWEQNVHKEISECLRRENYARWPVDWVVRLGYSPWLFQFLARNQMNSLLVIYPNHLCVTHRRDYQLTQVKIYRISPRISAIYKKTNTRFHFLVAADLSSSIISRILLCC